MGTVMMGKNVMDVFEGKVTDAILGNTAVIIQAEFDDDMCCRNLIHVDNFEKDNEHISLYYHQFELHVPIDDINVDYDENEESFHFKNNHSNVYVSFLD